MPIVQIHLLAGRSVEKKRKLAEKVTTAVAEALEIKPQSIHVILSEMLSENYSVAGQLHGDATQSGGEKS